MDSRKCQTSTASPAEPGELPVALGRSEGELVVFYQDNNPSLLRWGAPQVCGVPRPTPNILDLFGIIFRILVTLGKYRIF